MATREQIENWFTYHRPKPGAISIEGKAMPSDEDHYRAIREKAKELALVINESTPESADQTAAFRKLRECVMTANAAIACGGK